MNSDYNTIFSELIRIREEDPLRYEFIRRAADLPEDQLHELIDTVKAMTKGEQHNEA